MNTSFFVPGIPVAKGSAKAFYVKSLGRAVVTQTNAAKQKPWASLISVMAQNAGVRPVQGPVKLSMSFYFPRPKSHYRTGKNASILKDDAPAFHTTKPDADKLCRCVYDALTGVAYTDDSQVASWGCGEKRYSEKNPGAEIRIETLGQVTAATTDGG